MTSVRGALAKGAEPKTATMATHAPSTVVPMVLVSTTLVKLSVAGAEDVTSNRCRGFHGPRLFCEFRRSV